MAKEIDRHYHDVCDNLKIKIKDTEAKILSLQAEGMRDKQVHYYLAK